MNAPLNSTDIERRKPVWLAMSEFWLDTELEESDLVRIADTLAASEYSVAELENIYLWEVAPVVYLNTYVVAGAWAGFDEEWLWAGAIERANHRSLLLRLMVGIGMGRRWMCYATERHWWRICALLAEKGRPRPCTTARRAAP